MLSPATPEALAAAAVSKRFGGLVAVDNMSFTLAEREVLGLIGPNGSGKTTMMNLISGAFKPSAGADQRLRPCYRRHRRQQRRQKRHRPHLPAGAHAPDHDGARECRRRRRVRSRAAMGQGTRRLRARSVGAGRLAECRRNAPVSALTYIDQKRVELARALASDPKILLLDEWLAGLNPTELKIGIALIEQLRAEGCTIIIVEHVMHAIRSLCDRCIVMNSGAKIAEGTPAEVLADHGVIRAYLGDENA